MEVLNKYVFGSRLYGTHTETSDWDLVIVVSDETIHLAEQEYIKQTGHGCGTLHYQPATVMSVKKEMEIDEYFEYDKKVLDMRHFTLLFENTQSKISHIIISRSHLESMIKANIIWAYELAYTPLTAEYMTHPKFGLAIRILAYDSIHPCKLVHSIKYESSFAVQKAKALFKYEPDPYKAQKNIFHAYRFLVLGIQLMSTSIIYDYSAANNYLDRTLTKFSLTPPSSPDNLASYKELLVRIDSWIKARYPAANTAISIVRVIPSWLNAKYRYVDLRALSPDSPVIPRAKVKYIDREIRASDPVIGITKRELYEQGKATHQYLEMLDYGADIPLIIRVHHVLANSCD